MVVKMILFYIKSSTFVFLFYGTFVLCLEESPLILQTNKLPEPHLMPTLGNGNLGFRVFSDSIYVNYLFTGEKAKSHRARLPNYSNIQFQYCNEEVTSEYCTFYLNLKDGTFSVQYETVDYMIEQKIYPHRYYVNAVVNEFHFTQYNLLINETIIFTHNPGLESNDFELNEREDSKIEGIVQQCGKTKMVEDSQYQTEPSEICMLWSSVPNEYTFPSIPTILSFFMVVGKSDISILEEEMTELITKKGSLLTIHWTEWNRFWLMHKIEVTANQTLSQMVYTSLFNVANSMPVTDAFAIVHEFNGIGATGLGVTTDKGQIDYETELYLQLPLVMIYPDWSVDFLQYRLKSIKVAQDSASSIKLDGSKYPYLSGYTGVELSMDDDEILRQIHITADIGLALRHHFTATYNHEFLKQGGCHLAIEIGKFWDKLLVKSGAYYEIKNVTGIDGHYQNVNNNLMTNVLASYALSFGEFVSCVCVDVLKLDGFQKITGWVEKAKQIKIPYDTTSEHHLPHDAYKKDDSNSMIMTESVLLGTTIPFDVHDEIVQNNLNFMKKTMVNDAKPMAELLSIIQWLQLNETEIAIKKLKDTKDNYMQGPFLVWSSNPKEPQGLKNYLPAAAATLQTFIFGFAGLRLHFDRLEFGQPQYPIKSAGLTFAGLNYLGNIFSLEIRNGSAKINFWKLNDDYPIMITLADVGSEPEIIRQGIDYDILPKNEKVSTLTSQQSLIGNCPIPENFKIVPKPKDKGNGGGGGSAKISLNSSLLFMVILSIYY